MFLHLSNFAKRTALAHAVTFVPCNKFKIITMSSTSRTSCEPGRTSAYSEDLRWRMVWQREALGLTNHAICRNLSVDKSTVVRTLELFHSTGSAAKRPYPTDRAYRELTSPGQLFILNLVLQRPGMYLQEIQKELRGCADA